MCIRQADCILIVGIAGNDPKVGEVHFILINSVSFDVNLRWRISRKQIKRRVA